MNDPTRSAYDFFGQRVVVVSDSPEIAQAIDAIYERQRAPMPGEDDEPVLRILIKSDTDDEGPRILVGERTVRVPESSQLAHYAHLVLINAAAAQVTDALVVHSGAAMRDDRAVLLVGRSGSGKSTLTLELVRRGWGFLSDDFAVVGVDGTVRPFPRRVNLTEGSLTLLGFESPPQGMLLRGFGGQKKWMIDIEDLVPGSLCGPARLGAVLLLDAPVEIPGEPEEPALAPGGSRAGHAAGTWRLELDHVPEGFVEQLAGLPGVRSVSGSRGEKRLAVEVGPRSPSSLVAGLDELCSCHDVTVLSARRDPAPAGASAAVASAAGQPPPADRFEGPPSLSAVRAEEALPAVLAHALSLSGQRFLAGTSQETLLRSIAYLRGALACSSAVVLRLRAGRLSDTADMVEQQLKDVGVGPQGEGDRP